MMLSSCKFVEMDRENDSWALSEDMVEKIIAMLPFPSIFKARCLSKSWRDRLSVPSSQEDEYKKNLAKSFQKQVCEWSGRWGTFCPFFVTKEMFTGYNRVSQKWLKIPSFINLPKDFLGFSNLQIAGALLYGFAGGIVSRLCVVNILTQTWKQLPPRPNEGYSFVFCIKLVIGADLDSYKIILVSHHNSGETEVEIYDSTSDSWSRNTYAVPSDDYSNDKGAADTFLNGVLYVGRCVIAHDNDRLKFLAFDLKQETMEEIVVSGRIKGIHFVKLVGCNGTLLLQSLCVDVERDIISNSRRFSEVAQYSMWKIDINSRLFWEVAQYPRDYAYSYPIIDADGIFLVRSSREEDEANLGHNGSQVLSYKVEEDKFTVLSHALPLSSIQLSGLIRSPFQPGLNPFMAV